MGSVCWSLLVICLGGIGHGEVKRLGSRGAGKRLTPGVAAKRVCIGVADLPDLGRPWTGRDVAEMQRSRPEWLRCARATRAEEDRLRKVRRDAVLARRREFEYPAITAAATDFARDFARANLLAFLHDVLDVAAAETYVVDCGFDVSTHARRVDETNRERAQRGVSLSGRDERWCHDDGFYREPGTLGDLLDAPTGNTGATYVSGAGLDAETFDDAWYDRWALEGLGHAHMIAGMVMRGDVATLETVAGVPLSDADLDEIRQPFVGVADDMLALACQALYEWAEIDCPVLDPDSLVDMKAPISALPRMLLAARRRWDQTELLAAAIAGLGVEDGADGSPWP
jgi:hypothetical protein